MTHPAVALGHLTEQDVDWIFNAGKEDAVPAGAVLVTAGAPAPAVIVVMEGLLATSVRGLRGDAPLARIGPGGIVGETAFLGDARATETVTAVERSQVLVLSRAALEAHALEDPAFAARLYRGMAKSLSQRLQAALNRLTMPSWRDAAIEGENETWQTVAAAVRRFETAIREADRLGRRNDGAIPDEQAREVATQFTLLCATLHERIGDNARENPRLKEELGVYAQEQLLPYILLTEHGERMYGKPRGYAGDYLTIEKMYRNAPSGSSPVGQLLDACLLAASPAVAVRNRRGLLQEEIARAVAASGPGRPARVTSLACGPAAEIFDAFAALDDPARLDATLLDFDLQALAHVADQRDRLKLQKRIRLVNENLIYLALGRAQTTIEEQDLIYSIGLIDYFEDELVVKMLNLIHRMLRPGGKVILGNFHPQNTFKAFMDHVLEWRLIHRSQADMDRLFGRSAFGRPCTEIRFEKEGINLFAACEKAA